MGEKERKELLAWLSERKDDVFDFRKEMLQYCRSDVDILRQACLTFRELLMSATGPDCFSDNREDTYHPLTKQSLTELYALTMKKKAYLENLGMKYVCIWDHEFHKLKNQNVELKQFIKQLDLMDRLDPRESFFGGRTNANQLYYQTSEQEKIKYMDFTSLYPWVNKYCQYTVGHPTVITKDFGDIKDYFGIAKVRI